MGLSQKCSEDIGERRTSYARFFHAFSLTAVWFLEMAFMRALLMGLEIPDSFIPKMSLYGQKLALPNAPIHRLAEVKRESYNGTKRGIYRIDLRFFDPFHPRASRVTSSSPLHRHSATRPRSLVEHACKRRAQF